MIVRTHDRMPRWFAILLLLILCSVPTVARADINDTFVHFLLTSSRNLKLDLLWKKSYWQARRTERAIGLLGQTLAIESGGVTPGEGEPTLDELKAKLAEAGADVHLLTASFDFLGDFRADRDDIFAEIGRYTSDMLGIPADETLYLLGLVGYQSPLWQSGGFGMMAHAGLTFFDISQVIEVSKEENEVDSLAAYFNVQTGAEFGYRGWILAGADLSVNVAWFDDRIGLETVVDFDQAEFYLESPALGLFSHLRWQIGSHQVRDADLVYSLGLERWGFGVASAAFSYRAGYDVTGVYGTGDLPSDRRFRIPGDIGGIVQMTDMRPPAWIVGFDAGIALADVRHVVRYAYVGVGIHTRWREAPVRIFLRGSTAWDRITGTRLYGGAGGAMVSLLSDVAEGAFALYFEGGWRDWAVVDRVGDASPLALSLGIQLAMPGGG